MVHQPVTNAVVFTSFVPAVYPHEYAGFMFGNAKGSPVVVKVVFNGVNNSPV